MTDNFLNIPVDGSVYITSRTGPQKSAEEFQVNVLDKLNDPRILGLKWCQYTPYFNDGETCVFSVHEPDFCIDGLQSLNDEETYRSSVGWVSGYTLFGTWGRVGEEITEEGRLLNSVVGVKGKSYDYKTRDSQIWPYSGPDEAFYDTLLSIELALMSGNYNDVLMRAFGDHAEIEVIKEDDKVSKFVVETYEHE